MATFKDGDKELREYLDSLGRGGATKFAEDLGVTLSTVCNWALPLGHPRKIFPRPQKARKALKLSYGQISLRKVYGDEKFKEIWG